MCVSNIRRSHGKSWQRDRRAGEEPVCGESSCLAPTPVDGPEDHRPPVVFQLLP